MIQVSREDLAAIYAQLRDGLDGIADKLIAARVDLPSGPTKKHVDSALYAARELAALLRGTAF